MVKIDDLWQCILDSEVAEDGCVIPGHHFIPFDVHIDDDVIHIPMFCHRCEEVDDDYLPYNGETKEQILEEYGLEIEEE